MKMGTEDKTKVKWLGGLMVFAVASYVYFNVLPESGTSSTPQPRPAAQRNLDPSALVSTTSTTQSTQPRPLITNRAKTDDFHPVLRPRNRQGEPQMVIENIDPTIHTELFAKVQEAKIEGGQRNLFQFGAAAPVELPKKAEPIVKIAKVFDYPRPLPPPPPPAQPPPPTPPTPPSFKYYGLATKRIDNKRTAFFLDGEDIILATEGMTVKSRWKVIRIAAESVMLEDGQTKKQQSLAISEEAGGGTGNS